MECVKLMQISPKDIVLLKEITDLIDTEFLDLVQRFLRNKLKTGSGTEKVYRSAIQRFIIYVGKSNIKEIDAKDADEYLSEIDIANHTLSYKVNQLHFIRSFFEFVENHYRTQRIQYFIPIPAAHFYKFTPQKTLTITERKAEIQEAYYSISQLKEILKKSYDADYERFVQIVLLMFCGMRGSECVTILKENVQVDERFLMTGTEENARKSNKSGENGIFFCYPEEVAELLFDYIMYAENKYPGSKWLFPSVRNPNEPANLRGLQLCLEQIGASGKSHKFRKSLSTYRKEIKNEKTPEHIMETLSNHRITSLEFRTYSQYDVDERRKDYDRYFPVEYKTLLKTLAALTCR
jgi:integrase